MEDLTGTDMNNSIVPNITSNSEGDPTFICEKCGAHLCSINSEDKLDPDIVLSLKEKLDKHNSIAQSFRYARDRYREDDFSGVKLRLIRKRGSDGRVYNLPSASEVAALIVGDIDNVLADRDIVVEKQDRVLQRIDVKHSLYLGLQYPLLFPYGEDGYRDDVERSYISRGRTNPRSTVSMREFFSFRIQMRSGESQVLHHSRKLFQQFLVDAYTMVEGEDEVVNTGRRIIIPSSFTGGPRYKAENCKDAFAICRWAGYPHLFITITCNPKWPEITRFLKARNLNAEDRLDILCRVFKFKLDQLLHDLKKGRVLGTINAHVCTVEFQKRGLPHAHILLFLHPSAKPNTGLDIDNLISAEIPNKDSNPSLFAADTSYMMHEPCGPDNYKSPCMKNRHCSKKFPKKFCSLTFIDDDGFPHYKRRNDGSVVKKNVIELDNRYVVPYNAKLLLKYQAHINVEYTCQSSAIKYLFKYIHKGQDKVTTAINHSDDEIKMFYDCRQRIGSEDAFLTEDSIKNITIAEIDKMLQSNDKCLSDYPSMPSIIGESLLDMQNRLVMDELLYDSFSLKEEHDRLLNSLSDEHRVVYDKIISAVSAGKGGFFFLYGFGGTGKIFIWNTLSAFVRSRAGIVLNVASSRIASLLLPGGRTTHSRFHIPIQITEDSKCNIKQNSTLAELLSKTKLIIWDEAPMVHRFCFEALDRTL
ncbi:uncharacterized protein LOC133315030 [Gastrolobium bilobum]|uniref:uncharacterized protein LOC133315030 n=1 Tax=Gastrolobium bilobum TaxID=150636 RepID=UPI002AAF77E9|nr:uncharacterized protein LOC133315030 [Gastrolobium bilobum]